MSQKVLANSDISKLGDKISKMVGKGTEQGKLSVSMFDGILNAADKQLRQLFYSFALTIFNSDQKKNFEEEHVRILDQSDLRPRFDDLIVDSILYEKFHSFLRKNNMQLNLQLYKEISNFRFRKMLPSEIHSTATQLIDKFLKSPSTKLVAVRCPIKLRDIRGKFLEKTFFDEIWHETKSWLKQSYEEFCTTISTKFGNQMFKRRGANRNLDITISISKQEIMSHYGKLVSGNSQKISDFLEDETLLGIFEEWLVMQKDVTENDIVAGRFCCEVAKLKSQVKKDTSIEALRRGILFIAEKYLTPSVASTGTLKFPSETIPLVEHILHIIEKESNSSGSGSIGEINAKIFDVLVSSLEPQLNPKYEEFLRGLKTSALTKKGTRKTPRMKKKFHILDNLRNRYDNLVTDQELFSEFMEFLPINSAKIRLNFIVEVSKFKNTNYRTKSDLHNSALMIAKKYLGFQGGNLGLPGNPGIEFINYSFSTQKIDHSIFDKAVDHEKAELYDNFQQFCEFVSERPHKYAHLFD